MQNITIILKSYLIFAVF